MGRERGRGEWANQGKGWRKRAEREVERGQPNETERDAKQTAEERMNTYSLPHVHVLVLDFLGGESSVEVTGRVRERERGKGRREGRTDVSLSFSFDSKEGEARAGW